MRAARWPPLTFFPVGSIFETCAEQNRRVSQSALAHEFGHTVGMMDTLDSQHTTGIICGRRRDSHGFVVVASDSAYSDTSRSEFSVKERQP